MTRSLGAGGTSGRWRSPCPCGCTASACSCTGTRTALSGGQDGRGGSAAASSICRQAGAVSGRPSSSHAGRVTWGRCSPRTGPMADSKSSENVRPASRPARRRLHREAESSPPATRRRSRTRRLAGTRRSFFWPSLTGSMRCPSGRMAHPGSQMAVSHPVVRSPRPGDWSRLRGSSCGLVSHRRNAPGVRSIPPRERADAGRPTLPRPVESSAERLTRMVIWSVRSGSATSVRS